jgi:hypothetical protein
MRSIPFLLMAATGCAAVVGSSAESDAQSTSVTGVVVVESAASSDDAARGEASARFVRLRGVIDDSALRLVGASLELPPVGQCATRQDPASSRAVELLDVGAISIEAVGTGQRVALASRQVPDVVDLVSGTMYSARVDESSVPASSDVTVLVGGSADVPAFSVRAQTPAPPTNVRLAALDAANVELTWTPGSDAIYVDFGSSRCSFTDDGRAVISPLGSDADGVVTIHRVRREQLSSPGLDGGELRFDFARTVTYR